MTGLTAGLLSRIENFRIIPSLSAELLVGIDKTTSPEWTLVRKSDRTVVEHEKVKTDGDQFVFILKGNIVFCLGDEKINLSEGDILFFDGNIEHVPENPGNETAVLLAVYLLKEAK